MGSSIFRQGSVAAGHGVVQFEKSKTKTAINSPEQAAESGEEDISSNQEEEAPYNDENKRDTVDTTRMPSFLKNDQSSDEDEDEEEEKEINPKM
ncbi:hypothetical protein ElyMa_005650100 [Elysia marginata]|uniref:Uncharacterized protein n=1 Tax=Elysia marginata TaxID=1093978 RepID=A0AAV4FAP5_9GAST|nr:hypothetical protein ElyMa_005650100 [Elysia marginata]